MSFADDLKAQVAAPKETADVAFKLNGHAYVLKFTQMDGWDWSETSDKHPARFGVDADRAFGYNIRSLAKEVAPRCGVLLRDGEPVELVVDPENKIDEWADLWKAMSPSTVQRVCDAIFGLNEAETIKSVVDAARKVLKHIGETSA